MPLTDPLRHAEEVAQEESFQLGVVGEARGQLDLAQRLRAPQELLLLVLADDRDHPADHRGADVGVAVAPDLVLLRQPAPGILVPAEEQELGVVVAQARDLEHAAAVAVDAPLRHRVDGRDVGGERAVAPCPVVVGRRRRGLGVAARLPARGHVAREVAGDGGRLRCGTGTGAGGAGVGAGNGSGWGSGERGAASRGGGAATAGGRGLGSGGRTAGGAMTGAVGAGVGGGARRTASRSPGTSPIVSLGCSRRFGSQPIRATMWTSSDSASAIQIVRTDTNSEGVLRMSCQRVIP